MVHLFRDIRIALRSLAKGRSFTLVAVLVLSLAIGASTAIFSMVDAIMFRPFPFKDLDRLVAVFDTGSKGSGQRNDVSPANYLDWRGENRGFEQMAAYKPVELSLTTGRDPERVRATLVSDAFFSTLGVPPGKGGTFQKDTMEAQPNQIVISQGFWRQRLNGDPNVIGHVVSLDGMGYTVVGVMPDEFDFPFGTQVWAPWVLTPEEKSNRARQELGVVARVRPGLGISQAQAEMEIIGDQLANRYPLADKGHSVLVVPMRETADPYAPKFIAMIMGAAAFLLMLACANVANLQLARGTARRKEMAVRMALGATRTRLARLVLTEGVLLAVFGAAIGLPIALAGLSAIRAAIPPMVAEAIPSVMHSRLDIRLLLFNIIVAILTGLAFSLPAALQSSPDRLQESLRDAGKGASFSGRRRIGEVLVVSEIALAVILLIGAGLMLKGFRNLANIKQGFDSNGILTFDVGMPPSKYPDNYQVISFYKETLRRLGELPNMQAVSITSDLPALGQSRSSPVLIEARPRSSSDPASVLEVRIVSEDFFRTLSIPVIAGRPFAASDINTGLPVAIVSASAAKRFWPGTDALGQRAQLTAATLNTPWATVVGIVGDVNHFLLDTETRPTIYLPYLQQPTRSCHFILRSNSGADVSAASVRAAVLAADSTQRVYGLRNIASDYADLTGGVGVVAGLMETLALLALILSAAGIFSLMAYSVAQRTHEIGIRMALGAQRYAVRNLIMKNAVKLIVVGLVLGIPGATALSLLMAAVLPALVTPDPVTFFAFAVLLSSVALAACYFPLRRATHVDPVVALRY